MAFLFLYIFVFSRIIIVNSILSVIVEFIDILKERIHLGLPGENAQYLMAPASRKKSVIDFATKPKNSAVLILLYEHEADVKVILTLRKEYEGVHSNQVSFPGGRHELSDSDLMYTALREANEEVGIIPDNVHVISKLTDLYIPPSNFLVSPYLAYSSVRPNFKINQREVEEVMEVPLTAFLKHENQVKNYTIRNRGMEMQVPAYIIDGKVIWGATAMMLSELMELCKSLLIK
jgi:8-oxo-dGTP pyrophosphatase MutT (NUDIX family)